MGKLILAAFFALKTGMLFAQGTQTLVTVPINQSGSVKLKGWLYLPIDYDQSTNTNPVVLFYHGKGEAGTDPDKLLRQGLPALLNNGMHPDSIESPKDGKLYSFIVLSLQNPTWSVPPNAFPFILKWLKDNYRIDTNAVFVTGISAGGGNSFKTITLSDTISNKIAAAVCMSPAEVSGIDSTLIGEFQINTWFLSGDLDPNYTKVAIKWNALCNRQYPESSKLTIYPGGHSGWNIYYNIKYHDPIDKLSIWEWFLLHRK